MDTITPSPGRIVAYTLTADQAVAINKRRLDAKRSSSRSMTSEPTATHPCAPNGSSAPAPRSGCTYKLALIQSVLDVAHAFRDWTEIAHEDDPAPLAAVPTGAPLAGPWPESPYGRGQE